MSTVGDIGTGAVSAEARARLSRLLSYLAQDPANERLQSDAFEAALSVREWDAAREVLDRAAAQAPEEPAWQLRRADWHLARGEHDAARELLVQLCASSRPGLQAAAAHNLAFIEFSNGEYANAIARLEPWVAERSFDLSPSMQQALQVLWLRSLAHAHEAGRACEWAQARERAGRLDPMAAGIAALAAIDHADLDAARRWCGVALAGEAAPSMELLVACASLALADRNAVDALQFTQRALALNPADGRALSAQGFACLLAGRFQDAVRSFDPAVHHMPGHVGTWHGRGWACMFSADLEGARASFERALALNRNFAESHGALAVVLALQGDRENAVNAARVARRLDPGNLSGAYAETLLQGGPRDPEALRRLAAELLARRGIYLDR